MCHLVDGDVYVCTGLLRVLETEDELAVVLAHEIAHHLARKFRGFFCVEPTAF